MSTQHWYHTPVRDEWLEMIGLLRSAGEGVEMLRNFREQHLGPDRKTYALKKEANWIESRIEMRVSQLHAEETFSDDDLLDKTIDGRCAREVAESWLAKAQDIDSAIAMGNLCVAYRKACKPPMMPINYFAPVEKRLVSKLLKLRAENYLTTPIEDLRKGRGVSVISVQ